METIYYPPAFLNTVKGKHLLLDTNIFRDAAIKTTVFNDFFGKLKSLDVTLLTIDLVKFELLKGSVNPAKYKAKEIFIGETVENAIVPITQETQTNVFSLIKEYGIEGSGISVTDLYLGALLMQFKSNIFLITRDTTDFIQRIFDLKFIINIPHSKGIFTYGVYQYKS